MVLEVVKENVEEPAHDTSKVLENKYKALENAAGLVVSPEVSQVSVKAKRWRGKSRKLTVNWNY